MSQKRCAESEAIPAQRCIRIRLASPSPERSDGSDTESIHSCQGYETEIVKDTSDTSSPTGYNIEYEITDTEERKEKFYSTDDSDDDENVMELGAIFSSAGYDSVDIALLGDTSEENSTSPTSSSDVDPGLCRNDYVDFEKCLLCQTDKKDISYPYCSTCFTWKKNYFPSRPKKRQKVIKKDQSQRGDSNRKVDLSCFQDSNIECSNVENRTLKIKTDLSVKFLEDSGVGSSDPHLSEDVVDGLPRQPSTSSSSAPSTQSTQSTQSTDSSSASTSSASNLRKLSLDMCRVCFLKPENGLFVHINTAHVYGCYSCAKKIWYHNGGCPICRRKIFKVAKLFV